VEDRNKISELSGEIRRLIEGIAIPASPLRNFAKSYAPMNWSTKSSAGEKTSTNHMKN
jgi:hypothetical protein